jgi:hypothetical protein
MPPHGLCTHHCRGCDGHFTSLRAFDRHRVDGECGDPDEMLVEVDGLCTCKITGRGHLAPVTLYELPETEAFRQHHRRPQDGKVSA